MADNLERQIAKALEPLVEDIVRLERSDANALLEAQGMKHLEASAIAVRDYCQHFMYGHGEVTGTKRLPAWLR